MLRKSIRSRTGFTLIELLVVVAIIALLISILLPSLTEAREQGKVAKCLANMKNLMTTTSTYFIEFNDAFPFVVTTSGGTLGICNFTFAGKTNGTINGKETKYTQKWKNDNGGIFFSRTGNRPFNRYMIGQKPGWDDEMPALRCANDNSSAQYAWPQTTENLPAYVDVGTSYLYNLFAIDQTNIDPWKKYGLDYGWSRLGKQCVRDGAGGMSGRFVIFYEERVDACLQLRTRTTGHHRKFGKHTLAFLDGHASYMNIKTSDWCGQGWTMINPNWVKRDGWFTEIYYTNSKKNCDPGK